MRHSRLPTLCIVAAMFFIAIAFVGKQSARADTIYQELFPNASGNNLSLASDGWTAYGSASCVDYSSDVGNNAGVTYYNGCGGVAGFAFLKPGILGCALAATSEFSSINLSGYSSLAFSWYQNVASTSMASQLAVEIGGVWYVSAATYTNSASGTGDQFVSGATLESASLSSIARWYVLTVTSGSTLSLGTTAVSLPASGSITAAGLYMTGGNISYPSFRFDNFTISGTAVPEPGALALLAAALLGFVAYSWRKQ